MRLEARTAIVTGAAQGLGLAVARRFVHAGANVVLADINEEKVRHAAAGPIMKGGRTLAVVADVGKADQVAAMVARTVDRFGGIDVLVNNAGGAGPAPATDIEDVTEEIWDQVIAVNLKGTFLCCRAAVPHMKARNYGRIVNVSSGIARGIGRPQATGGAVLPYASAKSGILGLTSVLAKTLAPFNIMVNAVVPGFMLTEKGTRVRAWYDSLDDDQREALLSRNAAGRPGSPEELANLALFLASEACSYVSGAAIDINGAG